MSWHVLFRFARFRFVRRQGAVVLLTLTALAGGLTVAPATAGARPQESQREREQQTRQDQQQERDRGRKGQETQPGRHPRLGACETGQLCLWADGRFKGHRRTYELSGTEIESCVPLPKGAVAKSFANRTGRPVTLYQSRECAETGEFSTFPSGSWTPHSAYRARALKIWEH